MNRSGEKPLYRYAKLSISVAALILVLGLTFCRKADKIQVPPRIGFLTDSGFVAHDTLLPVGSRILIGIEAAGTDAHITWFHVGWNNGREQTVLDSGMNHPALHFILPVIKTTDSLETWSFSVMDRNRNISGIQLVLSRSDSAHYGEITTYPDIWLGAQHNLQQGGFLSLSGGRTWFLDGAFLCQDSIDILYYYDVYDATLSSPNESDAPGIFPGPTGLSNWTVKNETRYDTTSLTPADFGLAENDSLILSVYEPVNLKRKAKFVTPGMIISFRAPSGKLGLIYVREVYPSDTGRIRISVKIQK
jgi:hypothetical protein